jgi:HAD superfamily hydrolase (TIGR01490 family)
MPKVSFFDLDHTLIANDCDVSWKEFLIEEGIAPADAMELSRKFFDQYIAGIRIGDDFLKFQLTEFIGKTEAEMKYFTEKHCHKKVVPKIMNDARTVLNNRLKNPDRIVCLLTASQAPIVAPIAQILGIKYVCPNRLEIKKGVFTGNIEDPFAGGEGKIFYAQEFCKKHGAKLEEAEYFGDSYSDRFILDAVGVPVAVNPGEALLAIAQKKGWNVVEWN